MATWSTGLSGHRLATPEVPLPGRARGAAGSVSERCRPSFSWHLPPAADGSRPKINSCSPTPPRPAPLPFDCTGSRRSASSPSACGGARFRAVVEVGGLVVRRLSTTRPGCTSWGRRAGQFGGPPATSGSAAGGRLNCQSGRASRVQLRPSLPIWHGPRTALTAPAGGDRGQRLRVRLRRTPSGRYLAVRVPLV